MNEFINSYEYPLAWSVYLAAGAVFCLAWWKITAALGHSGWRDLLRGLSVVLIFTPWFVSDAHEYLAPASMVVMMDLLVGSTDNGLKGSLMLLLVLAVMLATLLVRYLLRRRASSGS